MPDTRAIGTKARRGVFISYARSDGETFAASLRARLEQEGLPLWQDRVGLEGGRDWWLQITEALGSVEFMALVMTPNALRSDIVRKEWRYARQQGVCVYPVKGAPDLDFTIMPRWMRSAHFYDLGDLEAAQAGPEWRKFVNDLNTRCRERRVPFMAEDLPEDFVQRPEEFGKLVSLLLDCEREEPVAIAAALRGAGGYGKTTLARALCHDERVQDAFDDGILWITLGETPGDLTGRVEDLIQTLTGERPGFTGVDAATAQLIELLADRDMLIVIDDVWSRAHLRPFMQGGPRCARLITTRDLDTLPPHARKVDVDAMRLDEAVTLLGAGLPLTCETELRSLAARLGEWPLLLTLVNGTLRIRADQGQPLPEAITYANKALDKRGLTFFDARNASAREQAVARTLGVSFEQLTGVQRALYGELAVFPEDVDVPLSTLVRLWGVTGMLDEFDTEELCEQLYRLSLLQRFDPTARLIRLHDVVRTYIIREEADRLRAIHEQLLDAHRPAAAKAGAAWVDMPLDEPYLWDHIAYHLKESGRGDELLATVKDLGYLAAKTFLRKSPAAEGDLLTAEELYPEDAALYLLRSAFVQIDHLLNRCDTLDDVRSNLYCRLLHLDALSDLTQDLARTLNGPYLVPAHPLPDLPHPALLRTLSGHSYEVNDCTFSPDGMFIVSASGDKTVKTWDARSGQELLTFEGHERSVEYCGASPDGSFIVSASHEKLIVWNAKSGSEVFSAAPGGLIKHCAYSPDGSFIVSRLSDSSIIVWDAFTWRERLRLGGDSEPLGVCAVSPDSSSIISVSLDDGALKVWDAKSGERHPTPHVDAKYPGALAISPDWSIIVSGGTHSSAKIWDANSGGLLCEVEDFNNWPNEVAFSPDSSVIVSTSKDGSIKAWDLKNGKELLKLAGHSSVVSACAVSPDSSILVSASWDGTLKIWDLKGACEYSPSSAESNTLTGCEVSPRGTFAAFADGGDWTGRRFWSVCDVGNGSEPLTLRGERLDGFDCAVSPDGRLIVLAKHSEVTVREVRDGSKLLRWTDDSYVDGCAFSPDGTLIVTCSGNRLNVWDAYSGEKIHTLEGHSGLVQQCAFSPDGSFVVSASRDTTLKVWAVRNWQERFTLVGHTGSVACCAVSSDSSYVISASEGRAAASWNGDTGEVAYFQSGDGTAKVWDARTGKEILTIAEREGGVSRCAINHDGTLVVTLSSGMPKRIPPGNHDRMLKVWEVQTGKCLHKFQTENELWNFKFLSDGRRIFVVGAHGSLYFLRLVR